MDSSKKEKGGFWYAIASFIVNKRKALVILFLIASAFCVVSMNKTKVNQDITSYLPDTSETRVGLDRMNENFVTYGTAQIMVSNVTYAEGERLKLQLEEVEGVKEVAFDYTKDHYNGADVLLTVTMKGTDTDEISLKALEEIESITENLDTYMTSSIGSAQRSADSLAEDMVVILILAVVIIVTVLLLTTQAFMEVPVMLLTFGIAALLNKGTNFMFGEISFVTDSIAVVLQLALAIDYAIILCDRYIEEHEHLDSVEACKVALSKAIPEIGSSSLTTVSGMVALMFMQFRLGYDMGIILVKAIILSLVSVFFIMPAIILIFAKAMDKTMHKSFIPKISFVGKFSWMTRHVVPVAFVIVLVFSFVISSGCTYLYDVNSVVSSKKSEEKIASEKIEEAFGASNQLVVIVPSGNYEQEGEILSRYESLGFVDSAMGLANISVNDDYMVTDKLTPRQFSELADIDMEIVELLYTAYAYDVERYGHLVTGVDDYAVPLIDMFIFLYEQYEEGYVDLSDDLDKLLTDLYEQLHDGELQLKTEEYSRLVLNLNCPVEGEETYEKLEMLRNIALEYYDDVVLVGNATSAKDLSSSFATDNIIISVLTALFVMIILLFTFQSAGVPVLLVLTIQGSIWINFSVPALMNEGIYFIAYLIVSAIQMGATIDYAIVISNRYLQLKQQESLKQAMIDTLNQAFPTIFTSGSILTGAGFIIGAVTGDATVASIGTALGRGTLISIILVLFVLPQILLLGDFIIEKTALTMNISLPARELNGRVLMSGHVKGYVQGEIDADITGIFKGKMSVTVDSKIDAKGGDDDEE